MSGNVHFLTFAVFYLSHVWGENTTPKIGEKLKGEVLTNFYVWTTLTKKYNELVLFLFVYFKV